MTRKDLLKLRQDLLDSYFLFRSRGKLESTGKGCKWCEKFIKLKFTCCLNCGHIIEVLE